MTAVEIKEKYEEENKLNNKMKNLVSEYIKLGLIEGYIDKNGKTILPKEELNAWK